jgi:pyruvate dehydrogenase E2 component (dihydrolipoamide acetyltransferase)
MIEFCLPSLGSDMDKGTLLQWSVKPGDAVKKGDVIAVVDTTKAAIDVECWHDGTVAALLIEPGTEIAVNTPIAVLLEAGETINEFEPRIAQLRAAATRPPPLRCRSPRERLPPRLPRADGLPNSAWTSGSSRAAARAA